MAGSISVDEVGRTVVADLTAAEAREIKLIYGANPERLGVQQDVLANRYVLEGKGYAGLITLSTGRTIRIRTKVPVRSILYMLSYARAGYDFFDPASQYAQTDDFFEIVIAEFAARTSGLLRQGLHQGYVELEDDELRAVRGRLLVGRQLQRNFVRRERFACRYPELTLDLAMNRALKLATYRARRASLRSDALRDRLASNLRLFGGVSLDDQLTSQDVLRLPVDRLTERYRVPLVLAALIIGSVTLEDAIGGLAFSSYLVNMNDLFQQFVGNVLREVLRGRGIRVVTGERRFLDLDNRLAFATDIELWVGDRCLVVADTKYKAYEREPTPGDRYQVIAYDLKLSPERVVLLYPTPQADSFKIEGVDLRVTGVNLDGTPAELHERVRQLADRLLEGIAVTAPSAATSAA